MLTGIIPESCPPCPGIRNDFMGTGNSASEYFRRLAADYGAAIRTAIRDGKLAPFFIVVSAFDKAQMRLDATLEELDLLVRVHICDILGESDRCFGDKSAAFPDPGFRDKARQVAFLHGARLEKHAPLGYGDCEAAVVFEHNCPNNSLPILWSESKDWAPLFKRV